MIEGYTELVWASCFCGVVGGGVWDGVVLVCRIDRPRGTLGGVPGSSASGRLYYASSNTIPEGLDTRCFMIIMRRKAQNQIVDTSCHAWNLGVYEP